MSRIVIMGGGIAGHTAALHLRRRLSNEHEVVVVTPNSLWNWTPSNIWVGTGDMDKSEVLFELDPVYRQEGIIYFQAKAVAIWPEGDDNDDRPAIDIVGTGQGHVGDARRLRYDYLVNATGPQLDFAATPGLGPEHNSLSVCTANHAEATAKELEICIGRMQKGERQTLVIGVGHGGATCEGAAFEYVFNVDHALRQAHVRHMADVIYLTNEAELGDFGVDGMTFEDHGYETSSRLWAESLYRERNVHAIVGAAPTKVEPNLIEYELLDGSMHELPFDFAMLLPPFKGAPLVAYDRSGADITSKLFNARDFMLVDADYTPKPFEEWRPQDWPRTYQSPAYDNIWAAGIAFAPPHAISRPRTSANGTVISPAAPRTGMPSGLIGKAVALSIADRITKGHHARAHTASMASMGAACVASAGTGLRQGLAAAITMLPIVPDYERYPTGRDLQETRGELGLAGHWMKLSLHHLFLYKFKALPGWWMIPE